MLTKHSKSKPSPLAALAMCLIVMLSLLGLSSQAFASGFYAAPRLGTLVALDEDSADTAVGIALGYRWVKLIGVEIGYQRIFSTVDNNFLDANLVISGTPGLWNAYALIGTGIALSTAANSDAEPLLRVGGGLSIELIPFVHPFVQLTYLNLNGDNHFLEPQIGVSAGF